MRDLDKLYRKAVYDSLNGNISVNIYDEVKKIGTNETLFVLMGGQKSTRDPQGDGLWARRNTIELIITHRQGVSVTKDSIDDVSEEIHQILFPDYKTFDVTTPSLIQFVNADFESGVTQPLIFSDQTIMAKVLNISVTIIQQLN